MSELENYAKPFVAHFLRFRGQRTFMSDDTIVAIAAWVTLRTMIMDSLLLHRQPDPSARRGRPVDVELSTNSARHAIFLLNDVEASLPARRRHQLRLQGPVIDEHVDEIEALLQSAHSRVDSGQARREVVWWTRAPEVRRLSGPLQRPGRRAVR